MSVYKNKNNMKNKLQENNNKNDICMAKFVIKNIIKQPKVNPITKYTSYIIISLVDTELF